VGFGACRLSGDILHAFDERTALVAIASNVAFIAYGYPEVSAPVLFASRTSAAGQYLPAGATAQCSSRSDRLEERRKGGRDLSVKR